MSEVIERAAETGEDEMSEVIERAAETGEDEMSEVIERAAESTAVAIIPTAQLPTLMAAPETRDILDKLLAELEGFEADGSTPAGRRAARSKAGKVSIAKQDLLRLTAHLKEGALKQHRAIVAEEKIVESRFNELRDKIKKPADDYEATEAARVAAHRGFVFLKGSRSFALERCLPGSLCSALSFH